MICPNCRQEAPTVVRGIRAYCTACGAPRSLIEDTPVNVAGQPSKIGGGVAAVAGLSILVIGSLLSLAVGALLHFVILGPVGWIVGGFLEAVTLFVAGMFLWGGRALFRSGTERERGAHEQAIFAIARRRGGSVTASELARVLSIPESEADAMLTAMARRPDGQVSLELDDDGALRYEVRDANLGRVRVGERKRVHVDTQTPTTVLDAEFEEQAEEEARAAEKRKQRS